MPTLCGEYLPVGGGVGLGAPETGIPYSLHSEVGVAAGVKVVRN